MPASALQQKVAKLPVTALLVWNTEDISNFMNWQVSSIYILLYVV